VIDIPFHKQEDSPREPWVSSRRDLLAMGSAAGIVGILGTQPAAAPPTWSAGRPTGEADVRHFGARGDTASDHTGAKAYWFSAAGSAKNNRTSRSEKGRIAP
jgi:hypothetical protein